MNQAPRPVADKTPSFERAPAECRKEPCPGLGPKKPYDSAPKAFQQRHYLSLPWGPGYPCRRKTVRR